MMFCRPDDGDFMEFVNIYEMVNDAGGVTAGLTKEFHQTMRAHYIRRGKNPPLVTIPKV